LDNEHSLDIKYNILVVDDDADVALSIKEGLEDNGFRVNVFNDPAEALANLSSIVGSTGYDLILMDVKMPKLNGFELYQRMKAILGVRLPRICFMTAYETYYEQLRKESFPNLNVGCFISKPVSISHLVNRLKKELADS
jgi:two-component system, OmpR family, response regulator ChvI